MTNSRENEPITINLPRPGAKASRLGFIGTGALAAVVALSALGGGRVASAAETSSPSTGPTASEMIGATPTPSEAAASGNPESNTNTVKYGDVSFTGIPENVDPKIVDKADHKPFINKIGLGSQMVIAEPGGLLVGPDFGYTGKENPMGTNPKGWEAMYESDGSINPFSPVTQEVLHYAAPAYQDVPEGGYMLVSAAQMDVKIGDLQISLPNVEDNNYLLFVKGKFGDNQQNTDKNQTAELSNYFPGHALVEMYQSSDKTNTAFISEGQFDQMAETSHSGGTNLGDGGASILTAVFVDSNTGAVDVIQQTLGRDQDASKGWNLVGSNWFTK